MQNRYDRCPNCMQALPNGDDVCPYCGFGVSAYEEMDSNADYNYGGTIW